jgi:hypothetical protein
MGRELNIAINRLRDYSARRMALATIPSQIEALSLQYEAIRSAHKDGVPVKGGSCNREDMMIDNIMRRETLHRNLDIAKAEIEITEKGLSVLTGDERKILDLFYMNRQQGYMERLCADLFVEKTKLYEMKKEALRKFALATCGTVDL